ncbi:hypothetical protein GRF59_14530 [Paenibacillus sp. HJL G12]|uniref:Single-stranded-DNA-specific exonuclease RecJ n=1 Tax=Paenibacillus dendrobii TaxID=2691084 RepID=A0A7X3IIY6_9BACL|nr:DHH family phosphoesterase [Paenibacillus dendrobii]MWV44834.1 hypothetical protein [Paenibacillus dendrobii]
MYLKLAKINGIENIDAFLNPLSNVVHSPYLLKNIDQLVEKIIRAIKNGEKIIIFVDVDYDGISSAVILYKYLRHFTDNIELRYVERSEGHGTRFVIDQIPLDTDLYIAVDSSSNDVDEMKYLAENGIECLVIDHHAITNDNPYAIIVNPQQKDCKYPNKSSCGALLVYKVCQVLDDYMNTYYSNKYMDMAGFALAADVMSMMEPENRYFVKNSLKNIRHAGLRALFEAMNSDINNLTANDFLFGVSPAVTAATRLDNIKLGIDFLMCDTHCPEIKGFVKELIKANEYRKEVQAEALTRHKPFVNPLDKVVIIFDPTLGKGMNGLVAQELSKTFNKPAIVLGLGDEEDTYAGSFRGLDEFSMLDLLGECKSVIHTGGHPGAGGLSLFKTDIDVLRQELNDKLKSFEADDSLLYDLEFDIGEINEKFIDYLNEFYRITGNGFKQGKFLIKGLFVSDKKLMGKSENTVKIDCGDLRLMKFKTDKEYYDNVPVFAEIEAVGSLNINVWKQYKPKFKVVKTNQLFIDDYMVPN